MVENKSVVQNSGRASQGERTIFAKAQGQDQGEAYAWNLVRWDWEASLRGNGSQIQRRFVRPAKEYQFQFQSYESPWKILEE